MKYQFLSNVVLLCLVETQALTPITQNNIEDAIREWIIPIYRNATEAKYGHISDWDTSDITSMEGLFTQYGGAFNDDISKWNTSSVTTMESMFRGADNFNIDISE